MYPIVQAGISAFRQTAAGKGVSISLKETGSTAGFRDLCSGRVAISNASRPINTKELKACAAKGIRFIEVPLAFDALSVVVHPSNTWAKAMSTQQLSLLWNRNAQGRINRWNQVNPTWPNRPIKLCGAGGDSGTFDYFNKAINGDEDNSRRDYTASEDDNVVVNCVARNPQALGYLGYGWFSATVDGSRPWRWSTRRENLCSPPFSRCCRVNTSPSPYPCSFMSMIRPCSTVPRSVTSPPS